MSQGSTVEEALANLKEATELYLEVFPEPDGELWKDQDESARTRVR